MTYSPGHNCESASIRRLAAARVWASSTKCSSPSSNSAPCTSEMQKGRRIQKLRTPLEQWAPCIARELPVQRMQPFNSKQRVYVLREPGPRLRRCGKEFGQKRKLQPTSGPSIRVELSWILFAKYPL